MQTIATEANLKLILALILALLSLLRLKKATETPLDLDFKEIKRERKLLQSEMEEEKPIEEGYAAMKIIDNYLEMYKDPEPEKIQVEQVGNQMQKLNLQQNRIVIISPNCEGEASDEQRIRRKKTKMIAKMAKNEKKVG